MSATTDPFREQADAYTRLSEEYTKEVTWLREMLAMAGHRTTDDHDCFLMNCRTLGSEVKRPTLRTTPFYDGWTTRKNDPRPESQPVLSLCKCGHAARWHRGDGDAIAWCGGAIGEQYPYVPCKCKRWRADA